MTIANLLLWSVALAFCTWRATRFFLLDSLIEGTRMKIETALSKRVQSLVPRKLYEVVSCPWCASVWVAAAGTAFWRWQVGDGVGWFETALVWLTTCGMAMACWKTWEDE